MSDQETHATALLGAAKAIFGLDDAGWNDRPNEDRATMLEATEDGIRVYLNLVKPPCGQG